MIPAIDPSIGSTDDRPMLRTSNTGGAGFSQALRSAAGPSRDAPPRSREDAPAGATHRARQAYGTRSNAPRQSPARQEGRVARDSLPVAANRANQPQMQRAEPQEPGVDEAADDASLPADVLQIAEGALPGNDVPNPQDALPVMAQLGTAAYLLGVHGAGEGEKALAQGQVLPGTPQAQELAQAAGRGVADVRAASLQPTDPAQLTEEVELGRPGAAGAFQPSEAARKLETQAEAERLQLVLQSAQTRNEALSRIAAGTETIAGESGTQSGLAGQGGGAALQSHLQLQGLLTRTSRDKAFEPGAPAPQASTVLGQTITAPSFNPAQLYETAADESVGQRMLDRISNEARWLITNNRQEVSIRLEPEHLGSLHMKVRHEHGTFRIELLVDNQSARHLLESNLQDLRNRLASDHPGGEFLFNVDVRQGNEQPSLYARAERGNSGTGLRPEALEDAPLPGLSARTIGQGRLNIYA